MCWNAEVSLNTFLLGIFSVGLATLNGVSAPLFSLFYISYITMQLVEYFAWKNLTKPDVIRVLSIWGLALVLIQPLILLIASGAPWFYLIAYGVFAAYFAYYVVANLRFDMTRAENGHLAWHWLAVPGWMMAVWLVFAVIACLYARAYIWVALAVISAGAIYYTYATTHTWGSLWCWIVNVFALYLLYAVFRRAFCARPGG